jgi:hypothetical protein
MSSGNSIARCIPCRHGRAIIADGATDARTVELPALGSGPGSKHATELRTGSSPRREKRDKGNEVCSEVCRAQPGAEHLVRI